MTVPGVGPITALTWALEMGDVSRFYRRYRTENMNSPVGGQLIKYTLKLLLASKP